nr:hypothetical protein [Undibacterium sp. FT79W]
MADCSTVPFAWPPTLNHTSACNGVWHGTRAALFIMLAYAIAAATANCLSSRIDYVRSIR